VAADFNLDFAYAYGKPPMCADFRTYNEDFNVDEALGFNPSGQGEHIYLQVNKSGQNTDWVARQIANLAGVKPMDVGYCGRKDRHAVTRQWFSIYLPSNSLLGNRLLQDGLLPTATWQIPGVTIENQARHNHKLRLGEHRHNHFKIILRNITETETLINRLSAIEQGVPNYFGEQRFGIDGNNLREGDRWANGELQVRDKKLRGLYISALRSYLFNCVLSYRVDQNSWRDVLPGDSEEQFPSGPLWGRGRLKVSLDTQSIEENILCFWPQWQQALEHCGLTQERRPLLCKPENFTYRLHDRNLSVSFALAPGEYATSVLREITQLKYVNEGTHK